MVLVMAERTLTVTAVERRWGISRARIHKLRETDPDLAAIFAPIDESTPRAGVVAKLSELRAYEAKRGRTVVLDEFPDD